MHWFTREWWQYLLAPKFDPDVSWLTAIRCRAAGHPAGVYWYSMSERNEPDMHCMCCGDDLG